MRIVNYLESTPKHPDELKPLLGPHDVAVAAPATVANFGPGFDVLGACLQGPCDIVLARRIQSGVRLAHVFNGEGLPADASDNLAVKAARAVINSFGLSFGVEMTLWKGVPAGRGLGSSAASIAAAAYATALLDRPNVHKLDLITPAGTCEAGGHLDNVAPCLLGGVVYIANYEPLDVREMGGADELVVIDVAPDFVVETAVARKVVPAKEIVLKQNAKYLDGLLAGLREGNADKVGRNVVDIAVEPLRKHLIPGFDDVQAAAMDNGALGCTISGSGPSVFAVTTDTRRASGIAEAMCAAFAANGADATAYISRINKDGAIRIL